MPTAVAGIPLIGSGWRRAPKTVWGSGWIAAPDVPAVTARPSSAGRPGGVNIDLNSFVVDAHYSLPQLPAHDPSVTYESRDDVPADNVNDELD
jgi:hypothetical protein